MTAPRRDGVSRVVNGIRRLDRGLRLAARAVERDTRLSAAQLFVLQHLAESEASSMNQLAARTMTDRSSVSVVVDRLEHAGLVSRSVAADDRRRSEIRITRSGRAVLRRAPTPPTDLLIDALRRMPATRVQQLGRALDILNDRLGFVEARLLFDE